MRIGPNTSNKTNIKILFNIRKFSADTIENFYLLDSTSVFTSTSNDDTIMLSTVLLMSLRSSTSKRRSGTVLLMSLRSSTSKRRSGTTLQPLFKQYILLSTIFIQVRKHNSNTFEEKKN